MWESFDTTSDDIDKEALALGEKKSSKHLRKAARRVAESGLPTCIAVAMFSKSMRLSGRSDDGYCASCGFNMLLARSFRLNVEQTDSGRRVIATCRGCDQKHQCGELPNVSQFSGEADAVDAKPPSPAPAAPVATGRVLQPHRQEVPKSAVPPRLQKTPRTGNKRRGSALKRLLEEEDSESDRSLSGFLNQFALQ